MKYVGIVGARKYKDKQSVVDLIHSLPKNSIIITSSCRGVCTWAAEAARAAGFEVRVYAPDLRNIRDRSDMVERYYSRNRELIAACEVVHAFISQEGGYTGGTRYEIRYANRLKKYVFEHWESEEIRQRGQMSLPFEDRDGDGFAGWKRVFAETLA